jgi:acetate kinase
LIDTKTIPSLTAIDVIGHRIVHGGRFYRESVLIDQDVKEKIDLLAEYAPLHNISALKGIESMEKHLPKCPQVAVFDTAFHHTLPAETMIYPTPYQWFEEGIQRFGFHGISYQYCTTRVSELLHQMPEKMVICHLGAGASLCAVQNGKSHDTTMGFTPLEGLMMNTRSGSIDPGIVLEKLKKMSLSEVTNALYRQSGLLGVSGISSDMRDILPKINTHPRARLAFEMYIHRLVLSIGSMIASLSGLDTLVFTAGIGENTSLLRKQVCERLSFLGLKLDAKKNQTTVAQDGEISSTHSTVKVLVIHTEEAFEIARQTALKSI